MVDDSHVAGAIADAFQMAENDDPIKRMVGFHRLERLGFAKNYVVGGRFLHLTLNDAGKAMRDQLRADATG